MFETFSDAKTFLFNHGLLDCIDIERMDEIANDLYRNAESEDRADAIVAKYLI